MYKKILALTLTGALAASFAAGQNAHAASQPHAVPLKINLAELSNSATQISPDAQLNELLQKLGLSIDFNQLVAGNLQKESNSVITTEKTSGGTKEKCPTAAKPAVPAKSKPSTPSASKPAAKPSGSQSSTAKTDTQTPKSTPSSELNAFEKKVVDLTNQQRVKAGLKPLQSNNSALNRMAGDKAADMRTNNYFDHQSPTYGSPFDMMAKYGIKYSYAGENIAAGQKTPEEVVTGWMNSPGHRANILNANYTTIGVGYVSGGSYGSYWTQEFIGN